MDKEFLKHLEESLLSFEKDPASSDFQRGYLSALQECMRVIKKIECARVNEKKEAEAC